MSSAIQLLSMVAQTGLAMINCRSGFVIMHEQRIRFMILVSPCWRRCLDVVECVCVCVCTYGNVINFLAISELRFDNSRLRVCVYVYWARSEWVSVLQH